MLSRFPLLPTAAGLDYTRDAFGPCTAPGVPATSCKVLFMKDFAKDDKQLDDPSQPHGTNVAGIIAGERAVSTPPSCTPCSAPATCPWSCRAAGTDPVADYVGARQAPPQRAPPPVTDRAAFDGCGSGCGVQALLPV